LPSVNGQWRPITPSLAHFGLSRSRRACLLVVTFAAPGPLDAAHPNRPLTEILKAVSRQIAAVTSHGAAGVASSSLSSRRTAATRDDLGNPLRKAQISGKPEFGPERSPAGLCQRAGAPPGSSENSLAIPVARHIGRDRTLRGSNPSAPRLFVYSLDAGRTVFLLLRLNRAASSRTRGVSFQSREPDHPALPAMDELSQSRFKTIIL
jgi:hypothetical protein